MSVNPPAAELADLERRLDYEPAYRMLEPLALKQIDEISAVDRYQVGDLVRVPRSSGQWSLGVVYQVAPGAQVGVLIRNEEDQSLSMKELSEELLKRCNPLKIGDFFYLDNQPFWVAGLDNFGHIMVITRTGYRVDPHEVRKRLQDAIETGGPLPAEPEPKRRKAPSRPLSTARPSLTDTPYAPIESILKADPSRGLVAGNQETTAVFTVHSPIAEAALHTNRGYNYKNWNEDAGALFADELGRVFFGVFDQAGGEGSDEQNLGAASSIAAHMLFEEMQGVAGRRGDSEDAEASLIEAAERAHDAILNRHRGEVTTFVGAMIDAGQVVIVNVGDSAVMHFDEEGDYLQSTEAQGVGRLLLEGLGMTRKEHFRHQSYRWPLDDGHYLVAGSDGLFDSRLSEEELGQILVGAGSAELATRRIRDVVIERMKARECKPDNLTIVVVRIADDRAV